MKVADLDIRDPIFYNPIINSNFSFWQRVGGSSTTRTQGQFGLAGDRFMHGHSAGGARSTTVVRSSTIPDVKGVRPDYSLQVTNNSAYASFAASEWSTACQTIIEADFMKPFYRKNMTLGFWLYSSVGGIVGITFRTGVVARSFSTTVVSTPGLMEYHVAYLPWDDSIETLGSGRGLEILIGGLAGSTYQQPASEVWANGGYVVATGTTNWMATNGAVLRVSQLNLKPGYLSKSDMMNSYRPFSERHDGELRGCRRYYQRGFNNRCVAGAYSTGNVVIKWPLHTSMRTVPTVSQIPGTSLTNCIDKLGIGPFTASIAAISGNSTDSVEVDFSLALTLYQPCSLYTDIIQAEAEL